MDEAELTCGLAMAAAPGIPENDIDTMAGAELDFGTRLRFVSTGVFSSLSTLTTIDSDLCARASVPLIPVATRLAFLTKDVICSCSSEDSSTNAEVPTVRSLLDLGRN